MIMSIDFNAQYAINYILSSFSRFLPVIHRADFESAEAFCKKVQECMCEKLSLEKTNFTSADKVEFAKLHLQSN